MLLNSGLLLIQGPMNILLYLSVACAIIIMINRAKKNELKNMYFNHDFRLFLSRKLKKAEIGLRVIAQYSVVTFL